MNDMVAPIRTRRTQLARKYHVSPLFGHHIFRKGYASTVPIFKESSWVMEAPTNVIKKFQTSTNLSECCIKTCSNSSIILIGTERKQYFQLIPPFSEDLKTASKKYVDINGKVSKDKWQSMFKYLARYVDIPKSVGFQPRCGQNAVRAEGRGYAGAVPLLYAA